MTTPPGFSVLTQGKVNPVLDTRRNIMCGALAFGLVGCVAPPPAPRPQTAITALEPPEFVTWRQAFIPRATAQGISPEIADRALGMVQFLPDVIRLDRRQVEFTRSTEDYLAITASAPRITEGQQQLRRHQQILAAIEAKYQVDRHIIVAIWGIESRYGSRMGDFPVLSALATLAFDGRRRVFFEKQLIAALRIVQRGDIAPERMTGSWAGAMGHTQFIPTSFNQFAVDFDGDGRRDIWSSDPGDALASAASYLRRNGWRQSAIWGQEVLGAGDLTGTRDLTEWRAQGVTDTTGRPVSGSGPAQIIPTSGPRFLVRHNFNVLKTYNNATRYAIGVGHLADRLRGDPGLVTAFAPDANGLTLADRKRLQTLLARRGFDIGEADGVIGAKTTAAIEAFQRRMGLTIDGQATRALLQRLGG